MATLGIEILDTASGQMAEAVPVQIRKIVKGEWKSLPEAITKKDGSAILAEDSDMSAGGYFEVLVFLGAYFDGQGHDLPQMKLVDIVPLRFGLEAEGGDVGIRMSITPHGYQAGFVAAQPA